MTEWLSLWASLVAQLVNNLPTRQETWVRFLDWENRLEKEMATHSSMLAWGIPWTEEPGRLQSVGSQESETTLRLNHHHNLLELSGFFPPFLSSPSSFSLSPLPAQTQVFFIQWVLIHYSHYSSWCSNCNRFGQQHAFQAGFCVLKISPYHFSFFTFC